MSRNGILFQMDSIPFPNNDNDYADHEERKSRAIVDKVVHSKQERAHSEKESNQECKFRPGIHLRLKHKLSA